MRFNVQTVGSLDTVEHVQYFLSWGVGNKQASSRLYIHCPNIILLLRITTEPVTVEADVTIEKVH